VADGFTSLAFGDCSSRNLADGQLRGVRRWISDADWVVGSVACSDSRVMVMATFIPPIVPTLLARQEAGLHLPDSGVGSAIGGGQERREHRPKRRVRNWPCGNDRIGHRPQVTGFTAAAAKR